MKKIKALLLISTITLFSGLSIANDEGYVLSNSIWNTNNIPVCWESLNTSNDTQRNWIRNAVQNSWSANSRVVFEGWGRCNSNSNSNGIRIQVRDSGPHVKALGKNLNGLRNGMVLNFTYNNWSQGCSNNVQFCSEVIAVHEFGHALGFAHEQNREDTPDTCLDDPQGSNGDIVVGKWDIDSVMNYCNPEWNAGGVLSSTDIETVQRFYDSQNLIISQYDDLPIFSADYYMNYNQDVARAFGKKNFKEAKKHWDKHGKKEGRVSSPSFNVKEYISLHPDLKAAFGSNYASAINHFKIHGINEGRKSSHSFNVKQYLSYHSDLTRAFGTKGYLAAHKHWARNGLKEGRRTTNNFDVSNYLNRYQDLKNAFGKDNYLLALQHWVRFGRNENRNGN